MSLEKTQRDFEIYKPQLYVGLLGVSQQTDLAHKK